MYGTDNYQYGDLDPSKQGSVVAYFLVTFLIAIQDWANCELAPRAVRSVAATSRQLALLPPTPTARSFAGQVSAE